MFVSFSLTSQVPQPTCHLVRWGPCLLSTHWPVHWVFKTSGKFVVLLDSWGDDSTILTRLCAGLENLVKCRTLVSRLSWFFFLENYLQRSFVEFNFCSWPANFLPQNLKILQFPEKCKIATWLQITEGFSKHFKILSEYPHIYINQKSFTCQSLYSPHSSPNLWEPSSLAKSSGVLQTEHSVNC